MDFREGWQGSEREIERELEREKRLYIDVVCPLPGPLAILPSNNFSPVVKLEVLNIECLIFSG